MDFVTRPCAKRTFFTENLSRFLKWANGCCEAPDAPRPRPPPAPTAAPLPDCMCKEPGASCDAEAAFTNPTTVCSASDLGLTSPSVPNWETGTAGDPMFCNYLEGTPHKCCLWISTGGCTQDSDCCSAADQQVTCNNKVCCLAAGGNCRGHDDECCGSLTCTSVSIGEAKCQ